MIECFIIIVVDKYRQEKCRTQSPELQNVGGGHLVGLSLSLGTGQRDPKMSVNIIGRSGQLPVPSDERPFGALFLLRKPVAGSPTGLSG